MHPIVELTIDGAPVAGAFYERLVSLEIVDKEGVSSDSFSARLDDGPPAFLAIPRKGALVVPSLGYRETGMRTMGRYTVDQVDGRCLPYGLDISGKAADLRAGTLKENGERHWEGASVARIVGDLAAEAGLEARVSGAAGAHVYDWIARQDETPIHFLERLARRHNALFAIKDGRMIFAERGSGLALSGATMGTILVTPDRVAPNSLRFAFNDRGTFSNVVAYHQDLDAAERVEVAVDGDPEGDSVHRIPEPFADPAEAERAARSAARRLKRGQGSLSLETPGDTAIVAGAPLICEGIRPGLDGAPWIVETATHVFSKRQGYRTRIDAKLYDGESGRETAGGAGSPVAAGRPAPVPDAPPNVPPAPRFWTGTTRNGPR